MPALALALRIRSLMVRLTSPDRLRLSATLPSVRSHNFSSVMLPTNLSRAQILPQRVFELLSRIRIIDAFLMQ